MDRVPPGALDPLELLGGDMSGKVGGRLGHAGGTGARGSAESGHGLVKNDTSHRLTVPRVGGTRLPRVSAPPVFMIALDATGSMAGTISDARKNIAEILARVRTQLGRPILAQFLCYRDYDVFDSRNQFDAKLLEKSPLTEDAQELSAWLSQIKATGGGQQFRRSDRNCP